MIKDYNNILKNLENLEISINEDSWLAVSDDLSNLEIAINKFQKNNTTEFYKFKYNELVPEIVFWEQEAKNYLKKHNIIR